MGVFQEEDIERNFALTLHALRGPGIFRWVGRRVRPSAAVVHKPLVGHRGHPKLVLLFWRWRLQCPPHPLPINRKHCEVISKKLPYCLACCNPDPQHLQSEVYWLRWPKQLHLSAEAHCVDALRCNLLAIAMACAPSLLRWGTPFRQTLRMLGLHHETRKLQQESYYWMCTFANNQHELDKDWHLFLLPPGSMRSTWVALHLTHCCDLFFIYPPVAVLRLIAASCSEIRRRGHWKRGICIKFSEIDFQIRDKFATILRTLPLMYETKYRQFCANLARNLRQICATPPSWTPPSRDFWVASKGGKLLLTKWCSLKVNQTETAPCSCAFLLQSSLRLTVCVQIQIFFLDAYDSPRSRKCTCQQCTVVVSYHVRIV